MSQQYRDFDKEAATWDENSFRTKLAADVASAVLNRIPLTKTMKAMDFGCGTGLLTLHLYPKVGQITGVDNSPGMLAVLHEKIVRLNLPHIDTQFVDTEDPLPTGYGLIVSSMALHHIQDPATLFRRFHTALTPGGSIGIADLDPDGGLFHKDNTGVFHPGFDRSSLERILAEVGFENIASITAANPVKPGADGGTHRFSVFLITARKKSA